MPRLPDNKLLKRQPFTIKDTMKRAAPEASTMANATTAEPYLLVSGNGSESTPALSVRPEATDITKTEASVESDISLDECHDAIEELYGRLMEGAVTGQAMQVGLRGGRGLDVDNDGSAVMALESMKLKQAGDCRAQDFDHDADNTRGMPAKAKDSRLPRIQEDTKADRRELLAAIDRELLEFSSKLEADEQDRHPLPGGSSDVPALNGMMSNLNPEQALGSEKNESANTLPQESTFHATASILESVDHGCEIAQGCSSPAGYLAPSAKEAMMKRATEHLSNIIQAMLEQEKNHGESKENEMLLCRLIVSNIAAGAEEDDVRDFFQQRGYNIRNMKFVGDRHLVRRTRTAQLDMWTRTSAVRACYIIGSIFGLKPTIELAVG